MPDQPTHPGVFIEEVPSGIRTIAGASTSTTAFVDVFARGPVGAPHVVTSMADFERLFGGLDRRSEASYAIDQFFANGGSRAVVVRIAPATATTASAIVGGISFEAVDPGAWGNAIRVTVAVHPDAGTGVEVSDGSGRVEQFHGLDTTGGANDLRTVVDQHSTLVRIASIDSEVSTSAATPLVGGDDGLAPPAGSTERQHAVATVAAALSQPAGFDVVATGEQVGLLCVPSSVAMSPADRGAVFARAATFCETQRAFLLADPPGDVTPVDFAADPGAAVANLSANAALWYPALTVPDPLDGNQPRTIASSGTIAGIIARIDAQRGVWKAPAGLTASVRGATPRFDIARDLAAQLNELGLNTIRTFASRGTFSWGARTLHGAASSTSEWRYVPVRRLALFIERSLDLGLHWAVFEPNDEPLWAEIRHAVDTFLHGMFRNGAFAGTTSDEAYFVRCDRSTTTQADIDQGIVNLVVGFAPLKPAEFVIVKLRLAAGQ